MWYSIAASKGFKIAAENRAGISMVMSSEDIDKA